MTKEQVIDEYIKRFFEAFSYNLKREQFCFIDIGVDKNPYSSPKEKEMYV